MISTANITMQFGEKPLFENISVKFQDGNRYGLIGANGCGKSTLMKILTAELKPTHGSVTVGVGQRLGILSQDQFAFEKYRVVDTVIIGYKELWKIKEERDRIYALPEMTEEDGIKVAELEMQFAEMDGYSAESSASELLLGLEIPLEQHYGLMNEIAPGWKLRVLLAQALFSDPDVLLLDEPTNNLDINSIRWLEGILSARKSTMVIISHDRHFLNGEDLGIVGMLFVLISFAYILIKGLNIAKLALKKGRKYSSYVVFGICTWLAMQVTVNIGMNLGLLPPKGFTLPLLSYGGTSMIFAVISLAIILRVDMENKTNYSKQKKYV